MAIKSFEGINAYIAEQPRLTGVDEGNPRFYTRIGIKHFEPDGRGGWARLEDSYHPLVQFGDAAVLSFERFRPGDEILAQGRTREYTRDVNGEQRTEEQFVAFRISHDPNTTTYTVDRQHASRQNPGRDAPERQAADRDATGLGTTEPLATAEPAASQAAAR